MTKKLLCLLIPFVLLAACNTSEQGQNVQEPNNVNYDPVSYGPNNDQANDPERRNIQGDARIITRRFVIPGNPNLDMDQFAQIDPNQGVNPNRDNRQNEQTQQGKDTTQNDQATERKEGTTENNGKNDQGNASGFVQQVVDLTNKERKKNGLANLKADSELANVAQIKSEDMVQKNYFSHTSPTYGSPFEMMENFGVDYSTAAENIAMGQQTPNEVVSAWMKSPGHRRNILNKKVTHIGVGIANDNAQGIYWTQMFIAK
jgi:uncharacterized YkwD family protein